MKRRNIASAVCLAVLPLCLLGWAWADGYRHADVERAKQRLHSALEQVETREKSFIEDIRKQPEVPHLEGIGHRVPVFKDYGHDKKIGDPMEIAKRYQSRMPDKRKAKQADLLAFVSFSMPESSLRRIAAETAKAGGVLVIRGFKDGSLKKTVSATQELAALGGELMIHPELFDQYAVTEVPTFVLAMPDGMAVENCNGHTEFGVCSEHMQVKGDVSLYSVLEYFAARQVQGKLPLTAQAKLDLLQGDGR